MPVEALPLSRSNSTAPIPLNRETERQTEAMHIQKDDIRIKSLKRGPIPLNGSHKSTEAEAQKAAEEFEAVFISQMMKHMFAGQKSNELMGGGHAEDIYQDMMVDEYGKLIARTGGIGLADHVKKHMLKLQEVEEQQ